MPDPLITLSGHTEGPWRKCGGYTASFVAVDARGKYIVFGMADKAKDRECSELIDAPGYDEQQANARLIAAAPDLLAIATELMGIARERGADEKYLAMLWTDRGIEPPQPIEGESE